MSADLRSKTSTESKSLSKNMQVERMSKASRKSKNLNGHMPAKAYVQGSEGACQIRQVRSVALASVVKLFCALNFQRTFVGSLVIVTILEVTLTVLSPTFSGPVPQASSFACRKR